MTGDVAGQPQVDAIQGFEGYWEWQACVEGLCRTTGSLSPLATTLSNSTGFVALLEWAPTNPTVDRLSLRAYLDEDEVASASGTSPLILRHSEAVAKGILSFDVHGAASGVSHDQAYVFSLRIFGDEPFDADWFTAVETTQAPAR